MNTIGLIASLRRFPDVLRAAVDGISDQDARWKPADGAWSILEVVTHLADEEVEDFRRRLEMTLTDPTLPWPPIDPEGWAVQRQYNHRDPVGELTRFLTERKASLQWLETLGDPDWSRVYRHPKIGPIRAGDLLVSWVAHDLLHLRQIAKRSFQITQQMGDKFNTDYAGDWRG